MMADEAPGSEGALGGLTVVDLSRALAGPHAAMMLGDLGAHVIKVESPAGDDSRLWGPPYIQPKEGARESTYFLCANRNKQSIVLDLKSPDDVAVLEGLVRRADVLVENFRPGVMARLGFGTDTLAKLNPRLVILSISGFGHDGPEGGRAGYDQIAQGEAGLMSLTGPAPDDPQRVGVPIADLLAGMNGAFGVLAALTERARTGRGQVVRTSLLAAVVGAHALHGTAWTVGGMVGRAQGNQHPAIAPYGLFHCADSVIQIACGSEALWKQFCCATGIDPGDRRFGSNAERVSRGSELVELIEDVFRNLGSDEVLERMQLAGVPAGRVRSVDEVYSWDQTRSQGLTISVDHQSLGEIVLPGPPLRFFDNGPEGEVETTRRTHKAPPVLDDDAEAIRDWALTPHGVEASLHRPGLMEASDQISQPSHRHE